MLLEGIRPLVKESSKTRGEVKKEMSEKAPFFSVIVPEHNSAEFMRKGLDMVRDQDFTDYELIIVCDACTDNTAEIAREYTDKVFEVNFGAAGLARNVGLDNATGEWILWMDDDDWYLHEFAFGMLAEVLKDAPSELDVLAYDFIWKHRGYAANSEEHVWIAIWNKAWRRSFVGETRFPDWKHSDDLGFAQELHPKARWMFFHQPLYYYNYLRPGSVTDKLESGEWDKNQLH